MSKAADTSLLFVNIFKHVLNSTKLCGDSRGCPNGCRHKGLPKSSPWMSERLTVACVDTIQRAAVNDRARRRRRRTWVDVRSLLSTDRAVRLCNVPGTG